MNQKSEIDIENEMLARKYSPLLVLYPEIEDGSQRKDHHHPTGDRFGRPPLDQDYHPRDIRFVLDHAWLRGGRTKPTREQVLDAMSENKVDFVDIIDEGGPRRVNKFWEVYAGELDKDDHPEYHRKVYARIVRGTGMFKEYISIQYWMAFFFDDWANVHEMDWEMVGIVLKKNGRGGETPEACVYNAHIGSFRKKWDEVQKVDDQGNRDPEGNHPVAYIANGSHAAYFSGFPPYFAVTESYLRSAINTWVRISGIARPFMDFVPSFNEGFKSFPSVDVIPEPSEDGKWKDDWRWLNFTGKWGSPIEPTLVERFIYWIPLIRKIRMFFRRPLRESGPRGPNTRGVAWENPFLWINLECFDAPESKPWLY